MSKKEQKIEDASNPQVENKDEKTTEKVEEKNQETQEKDKTEEKSSKEDEFEKKYKEMNDKYLRLTAEYDNYRKRSLKEKMELIKSASKDVLVKILPVMDDFERALKSIEGCSKDEENAVLEGLELIYNRFKDFLAQQGVKEIEATGKKFDTDLHEAVTKIPAPTEELKGKVVDVIEKGYTLNEKVIRFAKIVIGE